MNNNVNYLNISSKHFTIRLVTICLFCAFALTLYFLNAINFPCVLLVVCGALWNFFVPINTYVSFIFCLIVCFLYSSFAISEGLYANAILYFLVYIVLQFVVWVLFNEENMKIEDKQLSKSNSYLVICFIVMSFALCFAISLNASKNVLPLFDAISASMLGLSAFLQSFKYREYFVIRPIALVCAILLWLFAGYQSGFDGFSLAVMLMYVMYLVLDLIFIMFRLKEIIPHKTKWEKEFDPRKPKIISNKKAILQQMNKKENSEDGDNGNIKA
ncbi:MAG: nicotinamide mononucleotide transporter [Clostridia bacterium]|nr:nicotinamide mononucleotide transporter [Clostridia bacterium]